MENENQKVKAEPEPLTKKQELNNHIVLMRKAVRKGRVHLINKLTKEVKKLNARKGAEKAQEKAKRKADRLVQEIQLIKHLKEDRVSIYALQDKGKVEESIQLPESTAEQRSLARLSHSASVQEQVRKYRESNPYWELQIPVLLERSKDKRRRINKKLLEREALKSVNNKKPRKSEDQGQSEEELSGASDSEAPADASDSEAPADASDSEPSADASDSEDENLEEGALAQEEEEPVLADVDSNDFPVLKGHESKSQPKETKPAVKPKETKPAVKPKETKPVVKPKETKPAVKPKGTKAKGNSKVGKKTEAKIGKSQGLIRVQVLNDLADLAAGEEFNVKLTVDDTEEIPKKRPRSSFFVGGEEEQQVEKAPEPHIPQKPRKERRAHLNTHNHSNSEEFKPIFRKGKLVNKGPKRFKTDQRSNNFKGDEGSCNLIPLGTRSVRQPQGSNLPVKTATTTPTDKLHPSWEAKKRQQTSLATFKGKKTTFQDDE